MNLRSDDFEPSASASSASPPQRRASLHFNITKLRASSDSCLIQDEPETGIGFSYKMSPKGGNGMLGIDHQHGRFGSDEP